MPQTAVSCVSEQSHSPLPPAAITTGTAGKQTAVAPWTHFGVWRGGIRLTERNIVAERECFQHWKRLVLWILCNICSGDSWRIFWLKKKKGESKKKTSK